LITQLLRHKRYFTVVLYPTTEGFTRLILEFLKQKFLQFRASAAEKRVFSSREFTLHIYIYIYIYIYSNCTTIRRYTALLRRAYEETEASKAREQSRGEVACATERLVERKVGGDNDSVARRRDNYKSRDLPVDATHSYASL